MIWRDKLSDSLVIFLKGLFMGSADIIPGVSGGTIALITGIYERLVGGISKISFSFVNPLIKGDFSGFKKAFREEIDYEFFIPLLSGIGLAFLLLSKVILILLNNFRAYTFSFFLGLILASAYFVYKEKEGVTIKTFISLVVGIVFGALFVGFVALDPSRANHSLIVIFFSGLIAICAMILPGISGSFVLLLLGQYEYMLGSLNKLVLSDIIVFITGAAIGILSFSKLLNYLLDHYKTITMSFLVGLMVGTLRLPLTEITKSLKLPVTSFYGLTLPTLSVPADLIPSILICIVLAVFGFFVVHILESKFSA